MIFHPHCNIEQELTGSQQWISEVLHFCQGHPIILVGCKKDLRNDPRTIEELHKTSQKPVTPEQVSSFKIYLFSATRENGIGF